jgi:hypothetical protein
MWAMSPIEVAIFGLEGGVSVGAADIRLPGALSCATRQGRLLLVGADGKPELVDDHEGTQDDNGGDQASDGMVGHDIPSVSSRVKDDRARLSWNRQLDPATGCWAWQPKGQLSKPAA